MNNIKLVAFDLDGTLLNDNKIVSDTDLITLHRLKQNGIKLIAATGRNFYSIRKKLSEDFPMDYAVFSSGAGIANWKTKKVLKSWQLSENEIQLAANIFLSHKVSFTIHNPIPETHHMHLYLQDSNSHDLKNYTHFYKDYLKMLNLNELPKEATQMIALLNNNKAKFEEFRNELKGMKVTLATSPIDNKSLWAEVFNKSVSKANGIDWLCQKLGVDQQETFGIGNDYNDIDLLNFTHYSFVVSNGIKELKQKYAITKSNNENGFTNAILQVIDC